MYQRLSTYEATQLLMDGSSNWSWSGAEALVGYLEDLEDSTGKPIEIDVIELRCAYSEYESALEAAQQDDFTPPADEDEDEIEAAALEYLEGRTTVIEFGGGVMIENY